MAKTMLQPLLENISKKTVILTFEPISISEEQNPENKTSVQQKNILNNPVQIQTKSLDKK